ncbi:MAG: translocation/assembly module TamB domain-containing protein [Calditrichaeota bacterium]|nr:translocation/assembly module TamB domain-containing protein [Calditrichota bacterium]
MWKNGAGSSRADDEDSIDISDVLSGFNQLAEIDRILIHNGRILWGNSQETAVNLISSLNGYILATSENRLSLNLEGRLFESGSPDMVLTGTVSLQEKKFSVKADIESSHLKRSLPFLTGDAFLLDEADISGTVELISENYSIKDAVLNGSIAVQNMNAFLFGQRILTDSFNLNFAGQEMRLSPVSGTVENGTFGLTGNLGTVFKPALDFSVDLESYSAENLKISAPILELLDRGNLQGHLDIIGPPSDIEITGNVFSSQLYYNIVPFKRAALDFTFRQKLWKFHKINTYSVGLQHRGEGFIDFNDMKMFLEISSNRPIGAEVFPVIDRLNESSMNFYTTVDGDFPTLTFEGKIHGQFAQEGKIVLATDFDFELVKDEIIIENYQSQPAGLEIYSHIDNLWENPNFQILEIKNVPFESLSTLGILDGFDAKYRGDFYFSGPVNFPTTKINFSGRSTQEILFSFTGNAINLIKPGLKFKGHFVLHTKPSLVEGDLKVENNPDYMKLDLEIPSMMRGDLIIGYGYEAPLHGGLVIEKFPVNHYIGRFQSFSEAIDEGNISGNITMDGTLESPELLFDIQADNFIINDNGYYSAILNGNYHKSILSVLNSSIRYNNKPVIQANLQWDIVRELLSADFSGNDIESNFIAATIFKDETLVRGDMNYHLSISGQAQRPQISGKANMKNGILKGREFSDLNVTFRDSIPPDISLFQVNRHIFLVENLTYKDRRDYMVEVSGVMPADPVSGMNLDLRAEGNILAELPVLLDYFQNPVCLGKLSLILAGSRENPRIAAGKILIYNGSIEFGSVIPPLRDMKADIELEEGDQFIHIRNFEGKLEDHQVRIYNIESRKLANTELESWKFEDFGIDFGILVLDTDHRGIPLSFPGLMNPGDIGYFAVAGKEKGEQFYFAGPVENPEVRGQITLRDSRITFPFLEIPGEDATEEENKVLDFLMNLRWNVKAVAATGNRYFVDIPAIIGQVYLDLNIDNVSEGLEFTGRLSDETFRVAGSIESTRGRVEYLDMNFRVDRFGAIFNTFELFPEVYGRAWTTVRDSTDFPRDIYLVLYAVDPETEQEVSRGRWEDFRFKLISSDPTIGETQENVLAYLGYSVDNISTKAGDIGMTLTENLLIRPLVRPLERRMERGLGLDYVRLSLQITSNLFYYGLQPQWKFLPEASYGRLNYGNTFDPALLLLQSSEITLGKYLLKDIYFSYSGQLVSIYDEPKFGLNHSFGLEYRLLQNLLLEFEYDKFYFDPKYYSRDALQDFRIRLKHSFNF